MPNDNVLTPKQIGNAWRSSGAVSTTPPDWALNFARAIEREVLAAHPGQPEPRAEVTDAEVRALLQLEEAIRHDREMFEGTSDEDNPMGSLVTTALKVLDAARTGASS
ncbi:TPA: hypothetical protein QDA93_002389 [Burkholderia vietnamiensis]|nr:hypothetical protein [Burkholderia vietnamiensis]